MTTSDAFLSGKLVDENGLPPMRACFSVVTEGSFQGRRGFVKVRGDHEFRSDGIFTSPPLPPGRYFLRFFGILQNAPGETETDRQRRVFDFIYPNAGTVSEGVPIDLQAGESMKSVFNVPEPSWFKVAGRVKGSLPVDHHNMFILVQRNMGILPGVGGGGFPVKANGSFEGMLLRGKYDASIHEMTDPEPNGYTRSLRQFGSTVLTIERDSLNLEISLA